MDDNRILTNVEFVVGFKFAGKVAQYHVKGTTNSGEEVNLFSFYTDEKYYSPSHFIGMTVSQATHKFYNDDVAYLRK